MSEKPLSREELHAELTYLKTIISSAEGLIATEKAKARTICINLGLPDPYPLRAQTPDVSRLVEALDDRAIEAAVRAFDDAWLPLPITSQLRTEWGVWDRAKNDPAHPDHFSIKRWRDHRVACFRQALAAFSNSPLDKSST